MTDQSPTSSPARPLGRKLPPGARLATVEELFALNWYDREAIEVFTAASALIATPGSGRIPGWMPVARLLDPRTVGEASLRQAPSGLVLIVRDRT